MLTYEYIRTYGGTDDFRPEVISKDAHGERAARRVSDALAHPRQRHLFVNERKKQEAVSVFTPTSRSPLLDDVNLDFDLRAKKGSVFRSILQCMPHFHNTRQPVGGIGMI